MHGHVFPMEQQSHTTFSTTEPNQGNDKISTHVSTCNCEGHHASVVDEDLNSICFKGNGPFYCFRCTHISRLNSSTAMVNDEYADHTCETFSICTLRGCLLSKTNTCIFFTCMKKNDKFTKETGYS